MNLETYIYILEKNSSQDGKKFHQGWKSSKILEGVLQQRKN